MSWYELDIMTVIDLLAVGNVVAGAMMLTGVGRRAGEASRRRFLVSKALQAAAWALLRLRGAIPDFWSVYAGNAMLLTGFGVEALVLASVAAPSPRLDRLFSAATGLGVAAFCLFGSAPNVRVALASLATLVLQAMMAFQLLWRGARTLLRRSMGAWALLFCLILGFRTAAALVQGSRLALTTPGLVQSLAFAVPFLSLILMSIGFVLLLREQDELQLAESEAKYRTLVEKAHEGIVLDQDGRFVFANPRIHEVLKAEPGYLAGRPIEEFVWPEDRERVLGFSRCRMEGGNAPEAYDFRLMDAEGRPRWTALSATVVSWKGRPATLSLFTDIEERKRDADRIMGLLRDKETLLKEVHHRVKNNLALAASLLSLQSGEADPRPTEETLLEARSRLQTMIQIYDRLARSDDGNSVNAREYFPPLLQDLVAAYGMASMVGLSFDIDDLALDTKRLTSLGIIVNEACTNSLKYAFAGVADPAISLELKAAQGGRIRLRCADNGSGLPTGLETDSSPGLGLRLIGMLAGQLGAAVELRRQPGTAWLLEFPLQEPALEGRRDTLGPGTPRPAD